MFASRLIAGDYACTKACIPELLQPAITQFSVLQLFLLDGHDQQCKVDLQMSASHGLSAAEGALEVRYTAISFAAQSYVPLQHASSVIYSTRVPTLTIVSISILTRAVELRPKIKLDLSGRDRGKAWHR